MITRFGGRVRAFSAALRSRSSRACCWLLVLRYRGVGRCCSARGLSSSAGRAPLSVWAGAVLGAGSVVEDARFGAFAGCRALPLLGAALFPLAVGDGLAVPTGIFLAGTVSGAAGGLFFSGGVAAAGAAFALGALSVAGAPAAAVVFVLFSAGADRGDGGGAVPFAAPLGPSAAAAAVGAVAVVVAPVGAVVFLSVFSGPGFRAGGCGGRPAVGFSPLRIPMRDRASSSVRAASSTGACLKYSSTSSAVVRRIPFIVAARCRVVSARVRCSSEPTLFRPHADGVLGRDYRVYEVVHNRFCGFAVYPKAAIG